MNEITERLQGGNTVKVIRLDPLHVAIVFELKTAEDADHLEQNALNGLKSGEFKMRLRGKVTGIKED